MERKRCFVISPIGAEGSDVREHADDVFDFIVKPAIEECNVSAYRADQLRDPGRITDQMFNSIFQEDFCIAVLTGHNPNVFYELAVAQAAGKPVIILMQKQEDLPFDIKDLRCVYYDLKPRPLHRGDYKKELVDHIRSLERREWLADSILKRYGRGIEDDVNEEWSFIPSATAYSQEKWSQLVSGASQNLDMMGISLADWKTTRGFGNQLVQLASSGCRVRILLMDPESESLKHRINPELEDLMHSQIIDTITACRDYYQKIANEADGIELRTVTNGTINLYVIRNETEGVGVPYLYSERSAESPLWRCRQGTRLYEMLGNEFEALWSKNEPCHFSRNVNKVDEFLRRNLPKSAIVNKVVRIEDGSYLVEYAGDLPIELKSELVKSLHKSLEARVRFKLVE